MDAMLSHELRESLASSIRRTIDTALGCAGAQQPVSDFAVATAQLRAVQASITDLVQATLCAYSRAHNLLATVNQIPPEIFGAIYGFLGDHDRLTVSQVCNHWRRNATSNACLWTDHVLDHCGTSALEHYAPLLARTKEAPIALDITFGEHTRSARTVSRARVPEFSELLLGHMHHVRTLTIRLNIDHDCDAVMLALRQSAPVLRSLHISATAASKGPRLPSDLFGGQAPRFQRVFIQGVKLPSEPAPAFSCVNALAYTAYEKVATTELALVLRAAPELEHIALVAREFALDAESSAFAFHESLRSFFIEGGASRGANDEDTGRVLNLLSEAPKLKELGIASPSAAELSFILTQSSPYRKMSIVSRTGYSFSLTLQSMIPERADRALRAWRLHLHHFPTIINTSGLFEHLRDLTLAEAVWSEGLSPERQQLPAAPLLQKFTLVLAVEAEYFDARASWGGNFGGVFQLQETADPWECPVLRTVRLMTSHSTGATVARRDVTRLLSRHIKAPQLKTLELLRVALYGNEDLAQTVQEVIECPDAELDTFWPNCFPQLEWAGALAMSDNWVTR